MPLSISKNKADDVVIYPSPTADGIVNIKMNKSDPIRKIIVYNVQGQKMNEWILDEVYPAFSHQIELPSAKGTYLLEIYTKTQTFSRKAVFK